MLQRQACSRHGNDVSCTDKDRLDRTLGTCAYIYLVKLILNPCVVAPMTQSHDNKIDIKTPHHAESIDITRCWIISKDGRAAAGTNAIAAAFYMGISLDCDCPSNNPLSIGASIYRIMDGEHKHSVRKLSMLQWCEVHRGNIADTSQLMRLF